MTEKNEARVRTRAPMVPIGAKTLLSLLMAVVMLVGLLPVTALAAPTTGSGSKDDPYIVTTYADLKAKLQSEGSTYIKVTGMDHKVSIPLSDGSGRVSVSELKVGRDFENRSAAINIPEGAHKYLEIATDLWFIGDAQNGVSGYPEAILGRLIDLNAGSSLTITGNRTLRVDFNTMIARNAIIVNWGGNLTIDGDVTLDARQEVYMNIHGTALNLQAGTTNIYGGTFWGGNYYTNTTSGGGGVIFVDNSPAAPKLNIFGGTFKSKNAGTDTGWMYALDCHNANAKISLAGGTFYGIRSIGNISELLARDSKFFKDDAVFAGAIKDTKDTLSVQRAATLKDLTLNVGSTSHGTSDTSFDYVVGSDNKLSVSFNAGPKWFATDYKDGRINLNAALVAWENGTLKTSVGFTPVADYKSDGSVDITLNVSGLDLQIGKTYTIYAYIDPYMGDTKLADNHSVAQWTINAVEKQDAVITSLSGNRSNVSAGDTNPSIAFTAKAGDADVTLPAANVTVNWKNEDGTNLGSALEAGKIYTAEVKITAPNGYTFRGSSGSLPRVEVGNAAKGVSGVSCAGKTLYFTYTYQVPQAVHKHTLEMKYNAGYHWQECSGCGTVATSTRKAHELPDWATNADGATQSRHCTGCSYTETRNIPGSGDAAITNVVMDMKNYPVSGMRPYNFVHKEGDSLTSEGEWILTERDSSIVYPTFSLLSANGNMKLIAYNPIESTQEATNPDFASWSYIEGATVTPVVPESKLGIGKEVFETGKSYQASIWLEAETGYKFDSSFNSGNFTLLTDMDSAVITDYTIDGYYAVGEDTLVRTTSGIPASVNASKIRLKVSMTAKNMGTLEITLPEIKAGDNLKEKWATFTGTPIYGASNFVYSCYGSGSMKWTDALTKEIVGGDVTGDDITATAGQTYMLTIPATQADAIPQISITNSDVATSVTKNDNGSITVTYKVAAETLESTYIPAAEVTVTAPALNAAPNTTATVPTSANYTVSEVIWDGNPTAFEAGKSYKATVTVTANAGYSFANSALFSINGNTVTGTPDGSNAMKLSYTFPALTAPHSHDYGTTYTMLNDDLHYQTCNSTVGTCNELMKVEEHTFGDWQQGNATQHYKECSVCHHKVYADHEESARITDTAAGIGTAGAWHTECDVCHKTMNSGTIAALEKIDKAEVTVTAPVRNAAPTNAAVKDTETRYYVADTEWEPDVTDKFASGTKYTVKVTLEANDGYAFKGDGIFGIGDTTFTINGKKAKVVSGDAQQVVITYEFPATGSGSYNGGTGSGGTTTKPVKSPGTGDPGVMLYAAMGLLSLSGGAWVIGRKRKDK